MSWYLPTELWLSVVELLDDDVPAVMALRTASRWFRGVLPSAAAVRRRMRRTSPVQSQLLGLSSRGVYVRRIDAMGHQWTVRCGDVWVRTPSRQIRMGPCGTCIDCWIDRRGVLWDTNQRAHSAVGGWGAVPMIGVVQNAQNVIALDSLGTCWGRGGNLNHELDPYDRPGMFIGATLFYMLHLPRRVVHVSLGDYHACYVLCDGRMVCRGQDRGWGGWTDLRTTRTVELPGEKILESGATTDGTVVRCASGRHFLLGHLPHVAHPGTHDPISLPTPPGLVRRLVAGGSTVLAILEKGEVCGIGRGFPTPWQKLGVVGSPVLDAVVRKNHLAVTTRAHTHVGMLRDDHVEHHHTFRNPPACWCND